MKCVGYWGEDGVGHPSEYVSDTWAVPGIDGSERRYRVINHLAAGMMHEAWLGFAGCRICKCQNGTLCLSDGTWRWPEGYLHYIEEHSVMPPTEFINYVMGLHDPLCNRHLELKRVGFWARKGLGGIISPPDPDHDTHWPWPDKVQGKWSSDDALTIGRYLTQGRSIELHYDGIWKRCQLEGEDGCAGEPMLGHNTGSFLTDDVWVWPADLAHYVAIHRVDLPPSFWKHVLRQLPRPKGRGL
jgi:hypothetical protein